AAQLIRRLAASGETAAAPARELAGCWIEPRWDAGLTVDGHPEWPRSATTEMHGFARVTVAWVKGRDRVSVCVYLVDVYCLGVKNVIGPRTMARGELAGFVRLITQEAPLAIPLELAQHVVLGAVE